MRGKFSSVALRRISKPGGKGGNSSLLLEFSTLHGPSFPRRKYLASFGAQRRLSGALFAHRFVLRFDVVSVVDQPVQDAVGQRRIADLREQLPDTNSQD